VFAVVCVASTLAGAASDPAGGLLKLIDYSALDDLIDWW
jgi:hypothetical protein